MRLRHAALAAFGALSLVLTIPASASAAVGEFQDSYVGLDGRTHIGILLDPKSGECITLPEVADPSASSPAHSPPQPHHLDGHGVHRPGVRGRLVHAAPAHGPRHGAAEAPVGRLQLVVPAERAHSDG
ncbi:hypothetical protein GCM10010302_32930 [Streptomyces polychromogenes]|uniref:Uncharacterized protein n=1 Tax=Streptomyces polychromogenes TaxID=67342 RepID=A0ABN0VEN3_9ACTN